MESQPTSYQSFTTLNAWISARAFRLEIFNLCKFFPPDEKLRLADQLIRAARSIRSKHCRRAWSLSLSGADPILPSCKRLPIRNLKPSTRCPGLSIHRQRLICSARTKIRCAFEINKWIHLPPEKIQNQPINIINIINQQ